MSGRAHSSCDVNWLLKPLVTNTAQPTNGNVPVSFAAGIVSTVVTAVSVRVYALPPGNGSWL